MLEPMMLDSSVDQATRAVIFNALLLRRTEVDKLIDESVNHLDWLDGYLRPNSPANAQATSQIITEAAHRDAVGTARWLDEREARLSPGQQSVAYTAVAQSLMNAAPDRFVEWAEKHSGHPQYDAMVAVTAVALAKKGKGDDARRLVEGVKNEKTRAKLQGALPK